jgi:hypothetical protein
MKASVTQITNLVETPTNRMEQDEKEYQGLEIK